MRRRGGVGGRVSARARHRKWIRQWTANQLLELGHDDPGLLALEIAAIFDALTFEAAGTTEHDQTRHVLLHRFEALGP